MRICIDLSRLNRPISGMERYAMMISYHMIKNSESDEFVLVFREKIHPLFLEFENTEKVEFRVIDAKSNFLFNMFVLPYKMSRISADYYLFLAFPVPMLFFRKNTICTIHDLDCWDCPETMIKKFAIYFRISLRLTSYKCDKLLTVSDFTRQRIIDVLKYPPKDIFIVYNGIDEKFFVRGFSDEIIRNVKEKYHLPEKYILCLSVIQPRKNMSLLVKACQQLWNENRLKTPLVIAGDNGWNSSELMNSNDKRLFLTGYVDDEDLPYLYRGAEMFVFPSLYEGFGIPPLEAMACSTPVLSSDGPCMPEILQDAANYFENNNLDDLKEKLLVMEKKDRSDMIFKGQKQARKYSWDTEALKLLKILRGKHA